MGDLEHGIKLIRELREISKKYPFQFAFKLQYRDLDTFIHPTMKNRDDIKHIKRFSETKLTQNELSILIKEIINNQFFTMATPFDEMSVDLIEHQNLDMIKIASCSFTDWPLLEKIVKIKKPIIASTAGATLEEIDRVISFLLHRNKDFAIMHCVGEYPTPDEKMNLSQITFLQKRYPGVRIGFSTHENPDKTDIIKLAIAKGASLFEKHVGLSNNKYKINAYSATPQQIDKWLLAAQISLQLCGEGDKRSPGVDVSNFKIAS